MSKRKDEFIENNSGKIRGIVIKWGFTRQIDIDRKVLQVENWLLNFEYEEMKIMFNLLPFIDLKGIHERNMNLDVIVKRIKKDLSTNNVALENVLFFDLGEGPASSGSQFLYDLRGKLELPMTSFPVNNGNFGSYSKRATAFVFIDDFIGSGRQATKFYDALLKDLKIPCFYYSLWGFDTGIQYLKEHAGFKEIFTAEVLDETSQAFSNKSLLPDKDKIKDIAEKYGKLLYPNHPLGFENSQSLLCFSYNCPNNTLPVIWAGSGNEGKVHTWDPLFERIKTISPKTVAAPKFKDYIHAEDLVSDFYNYLVQLKYEEAYRCLSGKICRERYYDSFERFKSGYNNTQDIINPQRQLIVDYGTHKKFLVYYSEKVQVLSYNEINNLHLKAFSHHGNINKIINKFKRFLLKEVGVDQLKLEAVPINLFYSATVVNDVCWHCGYSYDEVKDFFKSEEKLIARTRFVDCKKSHNTWFIEDFKLTNHSCEPSI